jgi:hypothetical protein
MSEGLRSAKQCLVAAQNRQKIYYDQHRRDVSYDVGDQVLLNTKNIHLKRASNRRSTPKLLPKWIGPFPIIAKVPGTGLAYKLELPDTLSIHPVFHVSKLKPYHSDGRVQPPDPVVIDGEPHFVLERILDHRNKPGKRNIRECLVKWKGFGPEHNSWEPESSIELTEDGATLRAYWEYVGATQTVPL